MWIDTGKSMVCVEFSLQWFARSSGVLPSRQPCAMLLCGFNVPKQCANVSVKAKKFMTESLWFQNNVVVVSLVCLSELFQNFEKIVNIKMLTILILILMLKWRKILILTPILILKSLWDFDIDIEGNIAKFWAYIRHPFWQKRISQPK